MNDLFYSPEAPEGRPFYKYLQDKYSKRYRNFTVQFKMNAVRYGASKSIRETTKHFVLGSEMMKLFEIKHSFIDSFMKRKRLKIRTSGLVTLQSISISF